MAHFAQLDENDQVIQVLVVPDDQEHRGEDFLANDLGLGGRWIQTSYNTYAGEHLYDGTPLHKNYAGIGFFFDGIGFYEPQPFSSWTLNPETYIWEPPIPYPNDGLIYVWNEADQDWDAYVEQSEA